MSAITYANTLTHIPGWVNTVHIDQQRGYAYESNGRFFHIYGRAEGLWVLSTGLTASEPAGSQTLDDWTQRVFGATSSEPMLLDPGEVVAGVWRHGLYFKKEIHQALETDDYIQRTAEQALRILIEKLDEILLYIEPSRTGLQAYGHKCRELHILACTEAENLWAQYMRLANAVPVGRTFTTNDYVKLLAPLRLSEFSVSCKLISNSYSVAPFSRWNASNPTQSLPWYNAYNKTKHDREQHFADATLENCLHAIAAVVAMFCARHSPFPLTEGNSSLAGLFTQHFDISLVNPDPSSFYVPAFNISNDIRNDLFCGRMSDQVKPWQTKPLVI
ncbi:hypothetical protein [Polaromonas sp. UC242_47]|uniref:hypothetical protein n=1 Tax=Polaromonas sp. UC242_47 TaxID=3374626 RepID=UPI0037B37ADC